MRASVRHGFTLLEVLISIMIFSVVSLGMVGVFAAATNLFRAGESARAGADESLAVLGMLDDDLKRMVPPQDGGFLFTRCRTLNSTAGTGGNQIVAFKIRNPDEAAITQDGKNARLIVVYWVDKDRTLNRQTCQAPDSGWAGGDDYAAATAAYGAPNPIAEGVFYFGMDLSQDHAPRADTTWSATLPDPNVVYSTLTTGSYTASPFPGAVRLSVAISGGSRYLQKGSVVSDDDTDGIRVVGVKQAPLGTGAMACIGDFTSVKAVEWVHYDRFTANRLTLDNQRPAPVRRTDKVKHDRGDPVYFCPSYTLVRAFSR